jgi:hypothetical protein
MVEGAGTGGPVRSTQYSVLSTQCVGAWTSARDKINVERDGDGSGENSLGRPGCGWGLQRSFAAVVLCAKRAKNNPRSG